MNILDRVALSMGYEKRSPIIATPQTVEKAEREGVAQNPLAAAYAAVNTQWGLRRPSKITLQTLRQMSMANWVDRTCIVTLRDEITGIPWDIVPVDPKKPYNPTFQKLMIRLLRQPNRNNENWRTLIDKVMEDILVVDAGCIEKVRNGKGQVVELYHVDGATIKPKFDEHGMAGDPAYEQWLPGQKSDKPQAEWGNDDLVYIMWNPQGAVDMFGYGMSPVEAGLAVGTAFLYAEAYNMGFFKTNTIPPVIINMGKDVNANQVESFKMFLAAEMGGVNGFHQPVIGSFGDGFDIKTLLSNPKDMAWKEYVEWQMKWKVALYRMSPQDIGFSLDMYKVEGEVQQQLSKNKAIRSLQNVIAEFINREIIDDWGYEGASDNMQFQWIDTDTVDPKAQAEIDEIYLRNGKISINEVRRRDGDDPIAGGVRPTIILGSQILPLDHTPLEEDEGEESSASVQKAFVPQEGQIVSLANNQTAIAWMDDRGVTQPFFVADFGKTKGFALKPAFLDDKKGQEPPEEKVAEMLRLLKVNTPEVRIMSGDEVLKLLPLDLYSNWAKYLSVEAPYYSKEWIDRWGTSRKSQYYIVSGLITGKDLGNDDLQKAMQALALITYTQFPIINDGSVLMQGTSPTLCQSFVAPGTANLSDLKLLLANTTATGNLIVAIYPDVNNGPGPTPIANSTKTIAVGGIGASIAWFDIPYSGTLPALTAGTTYWIRAYLDTAQTGGNGIVWYFLDNDYYIAGMAYSPENPGLFTAGQDLQFFVGLDDNAFQMTKNTYLGITRGNLATSFNLSPSYAQYKKIKDCVEDLSNTNNGIDFNITVAIDATTNLLTKSFNAFYPRQGVDNTDLNFIYPGNIKKIDKPKDGKTMVNEVAMRGQGYGLQQTTVTVLDTASIQSYGLRQDVQNEADVPDTDTLTSLGREVIRIRKDPLDLPNLTLDGNIAPHIGDYGVGDLILIQVSNAGAVTLTQAYRIERIDVKIDDDDQEEVELTISLA